MEFICKTLYPKIELFLSIIENELYNKNIFFRKYSFCYRVHPLYDNINYTDLEAGLLYFGNNNQQNNINHDNYAYDDLYIKV